MAENGPAFSGGGGGIYSSDGTVGLTNCTISGNTTTGGSDNDQYASGAPGNRFGGGIYNGCSLLALNGCTVGGNSASGGAVSPGGYESGGTAGGGGIYSPNPLTLVNCTISGNQVTGGGTQTVNPVATERDFVSPRGARSGHIRIDLDATRDKAAGQKILSAQGCDVTAISRVF